MRAYLLAELEKEYDSVHGCYQPLGGPCFYIASSPTAADYGRRRGRIFVAARETRDGELQIKIVLRFLVGQMALLARGNEIGDLDAFCRDVGLTKLHEILDQDHETQREEEIFLTRESGDAEFRKPHPAEAIRRYQALKNELLVVLAAHHAKGTKRVPKNVLLEDLCHDLRQIDRALNELVELALLRDLNHSSGMRLTAEGQKSAEASLMNHNQFLSGRQGRAGGFDFFVSYASEDCDLAEAIDAALTERGYKVWRDRGQLTLGDSLTEKINEGLAGSRYALVILSKAFLKKNWPKAELNALQARAIAEGQKVILPVRRDLAHEEMARHLPLLGDKLTVSFEDNLEELVSEIERAVEPNG
jgi:hypothetical protein